MDLFRKVYSLYNHQQFFFSFVYFLFQTCSSKDAAQLIICKSNPSNVLLKSTLGLNVSCHGALKFPTRYHIRKLQYFWFCDTWMKWILGNNDSYIDHIEIMSTLFSFTLWIFESIKGRHKDEGRCWRLKSNSRVKPGWFAYLETWFQWESSFLPPAVKPKLFNQTECELQIFMYQI